MRRSRGGISPIMGTMLIVLITVIAALITYMYVTGALKPPVSGEMGYPEISIDIVEYRGAIIVYVRNKGSGDAVITAAYLEDAKGEVVAGPSRVPGLPKRIPAGGTGRVVICPETLSPGTYRVRVVERSGVEAGKTIEVTGTTIDSYMGVLVDSYSYASPLTPSWGYYAKYYDIEGLPTYPDVDLLIAGAYDNRTMEERYDPAIDYTDSSSYGGVSWGLPKTDRFAAVWRAVFFAPVTGVYTVSAYADDGIVVIIDGVRVIDAWVLQAPTRYSADVRLEEGPHNITIAYFENYGIARLKVAFDFKGTRVTGGVLDAYYYDLSNEGSWPPPLDAVRLGAYPLITQRNEALEDLNYSDHSDYPGKQWPFADIRATDDFGVVWRGTFTLDEAGMYRLVVESDDGVAVWVDGEEVLEDWTLHAPRTGSVDLYLTSGPHNIEVVYFEHHGIARLMLELRFIGPKPRIILSPANASFYDLSTWPSWDQEGVDEIRDSLLQGQLPLIGNYTVDEISFSDHRDDYPYNPWPFEGERTPNNFAGLFKATLTVDMDCALYLRVHSDDGVTVWIDGVEAFSDWTLHAPRWGSSLVALMKGSHELKIAYFEHYGIAVLHLELDARMYLNPSPTGGSKVEVRFSRSSLSSLPESFKVTVIDSDGNVICERLATRLEVEEQGLKLAFTDVEKPGYVIGVVVIWAP